MNETQFCSRCGTLLHGSQKLQGSCPRCLMQLGLETPSVPAPGAAPTIEEVQALLPQYDVLECIGRGGMGAVYRARQRSLQRIVALKVLLPKLGSDPAFAERFLREAQALANLNHPGIVHVFDFGQAGDCWFFAMEYVDGANLRELVRSQRIAPPQALGIVGQISAALQYAHDRGVVHRDIKPENILVDRTGTVKLTDFGLAKLIERPEDLGLTRSDQVMGTLHYMAPEQVEKPLSVDHRADIYSLGVVFYELLTGELPLGRFTAPSKHPGVDERLDEVVLRALEKEPARRWQQAREVEDQVQRISSTEAPRRASPAGPRAAEPVVRAVPPHADPSLRRGWGCLLLVLLLIAFGVLGMAYMFLSFAPVEMDHAEIQSGGTLHSEQWLQAEMASWSAQDLVSFDADGWPMLGRHRLAGDGAPLSLEEIDALGPKASGLAVLDPEQRREIESLLCTACGEYRELEALHRRSTFDAEGKLRVEIDAFPSHRSALRSWWLTRAEEVVGSRGKASRIYALFQSLAPFGELGIEFSIRSQADAFQVACFARSDSGRSSEFSIERRLPKLPAKLQRLWDEAQDPAALAPLPTVPGGLLLVTDRAFEVEAPAPYQGTARGLLATLLGLAAFGVLLVAVALFLFGSRRRRRR